MPQKINYNVQIRLSLSSSLSIQDFSIDFYGRKWSIFVLGYLLFIHWITTYMMTVCLFKLIFSNFFHNEKTNIFSFSHNQKLF